MPDDKKRECVFIRPAPADPCEVCRWPSEGLAARLVRAMRERHGKGGINVCIDCIKRARQNAFGKEG